MAGKTKINGTAYTIKGGKTKVNGTSYSIGGGYTKIGGTAKKISFSRLPSGFQECEYIASSGSQYLNIGYAFSNYNYVECEFKLNQIHANDTIFGVQEDNMFIFIVNWDDSSKYTYHDTTNETNWGTTDTTSKHKLLCSGGSVYFDNSRKCNAAYTSISSDVYVLCRHMYGYPNCCAYANMYSFIIKKDNTYIRNLVPCYCTTTVTGYKGTNAVSVGSGTIGMYDLANSRFYVNCGGGTFTKGADV